MSGNLLIDKLGFYAPIPDLTDLGADVNSQLNQMNKCMETFFPQKAYTIKTSRQKLSLCFTPTRYLKNDEKYTDTNLEMPTEDELYEFFIELGLYSLDDNVIDKYRMSVLHLTKNNYMDNPPIVYINFLSNRQYKKRFKALQHHSSDTNKTLYVTTLAKHFTEKDKVGDRQYLFYDKAQELQDKANIKEIVLRLGLSEEERALIPFEAYDSKTKTLRLEKVNILRCELQYRYKPKLQNISNFLIGKKGKDGLKMKTLLDLLKERKLYETLEKYYIKALQDVIFYQEPVIKEKVKLNNYEQMFSELINENPLPPSLMKIFKDNGFGDSFSNLLKKIHSSDINPLYTELYNKLGIAKTVAVLA